MVAVVDQVEVAEDSKQDKGNRQFQSLAGELALHVGRERVERIGNHRRSRDDADALVQKVRSVVLQNGPVIRGATPEQYQFMTALAEGNKKSQQCGADNQPRGDGNVNHYAPRNHSQ